MFELCSPDDLRPRGLGTSKGPDVFAEHPARIEGGSAEFAIAAVLPSGEIGGVVHLAASSDAGRTPTTTSWPART